MPATKYHKGTLIKDIKLHVDPDKTYRISYYSKKQRYSFEGKLFYKTKDHVTFENRHNVLESFLIKDFFIKEYKLKEL